VLDAAVIAVRGTLVVTGASRGIGAAVCRLAAAQGYAVIVNFVADEKAAGAVVDDIRSRGGRAAAVRADVARESDVMNLFEQAGQFGPLQGLVNNAGITGGFSRVESVTAAMLERLWAVNVTGTILCAREAVRRLSLRHGGRGGAIVNISSRAADLGSPGEWVHYAASKGAVNTFTVGLASEVAGEGIRVNGVAPGLIETGIHAAAGDPGRLARLAGRIPMGRAGTAEETAEAVIWLLSPAASYVTGCILPVSGGR
jgi:NAD(P)-dependent dehydrogenase (short-subunit alcohol dehydrogenase family)